MVRLLYIIKSKISKICQYLRKEGCRTGKLKFN
uniref:Uncharacterized protein n=1 Tax=Rhizophora mucronata TaxID=61149 RepID=A0A2P2P7G6_RHIMU